MIYPPEVEEFLTKYDRIFLIVITSWMTLKTKDPEGIDAGHKICTR